MANNNNFQEGTTNPCDPCKNVSVFDCGCADNSPQDVQRQRMIDIENVLHKDFENSLAVLRERSEHTGQSVYEHLTKLIMRIMNERPENVIDYFEEFSYETRSNGLCDRRGGNGTVTFQTIYEEPNRVKTARIFLKYLQKLRCNDVKKGLTALNLHSKQEWMVENIMHLQYYWSQIGYGFTKQQSFLLACTLCKFELDPLIKTCRFWGQLYGINNSYWIFEVQFIAEEIHRRQGVEMYDLHEKYITETALKKEEDAKGLITPDILIPTRPESYITEDKLLQKSNYKLNILGLPFFPKPIRNEILDEKAGTGVNRYTYYTCIQLGDNPIELPNISPKHIQISRKINNYLTGDLETDVISYPEFPGLEKHYMRTMIARITASNYISPRGFYQIDNRDVVQNAEDEEEEEEEEEAENEENDTEGSGVEMSDKNDRPVMLNPKYVSLPIADLYQIRNWVHHRPYILPQGRVNWIDPKQTLHFRDDEGEEEADKLNEFDDEEEEEENEEADGKVESEKGPVLFTSCENDHQMVSNDDPWTIRTSIITCTQNSFMHVRSNLWPGAFSFALNQIHDNIYIGWGLKSQEYKHSPEHIPGILEQYLDGPEIMEINDPTVEEEEAWRLAHMPKVKRIVEEQSDGEGENEAEIDDEDFIGDPDEDTD